MPLAALPTLPTTQTALLKLIEAIVNSQTPQGKVLILKQVSPTFSPSPLHLHFHPHSPPRNTHSGREI
jgi:hypothetical protein